jgi:hypothetical protein
MREAVKKVWISPSDSRSPGSILRKKIIQAPHASILPQKLIGYLPPSSLSANDT